VVLACALGVAAAAVVVAPGHAGSPLTASVTRIVDGDTLVARLGSGRSERVRLLGIDTPEVGTCYAAQATAAARSLALGKTVRLVGDSTQDVRDRYSRLLAYVVLPGGVDLGRTLVGRGAAKVYVYDRPFARVSGYRSAESSARRLSLGLWKMCEQTNAVPPTPTRGSCDPSYPTVCIPPPPPDLDCKDVPYHDFKVLPPDPHHFDGRDDDGVGCES